MTFVQTIPPYPSQKPVHRSCGFRICAFQKSAVFPPLSAAAPWRKFSFFSISHLIHGRGIFKGEDGSRISYGPGDAVLVSPNMVHRYGGDGVAYTEDFLCFDGPLSYQLLNSGLIRPGVYRFQADRPLLRFMDYANDPGDDGQLKAAIRFQHFLIELANGKELFLEINSRGKEAFGGRSAGDGVVMRIRQLMLMIQQDCYRWWKVSEMADWCHVSVNHFRLLFRGCSGMNPRDYVEELKVQEASRQLQRGEVGIETLARDLGYQDRFHFSKVFKKRIGISPGAYRKNFRL